MLKQRPLKPLILLALLLSQGSSMAVIGDGEEEITVRIPGQVCLDETRVERFMPEGPSGAPWWRLRHVVVVPTAHQDSAADVFVWFATAAAPEQRIFINADGLPSGSEPISYLYSSALPAAYEVDLSAPADSLATLPADGQLFSGLGQRRPGGSATTAFQEMLEQGRYAAIAQLNPIAADNARIYCIDIAGATVYE